MNKTLIIAAHPHLAQSAVNRRWLDALRQHPERFTVHELYATYPHWWTRIKPWFCSSPCIGLTARRC